MGPKPASQRSREKQPEYWAHLQYLLRQRKKRWEIKREISYLRLQLEMSPPHKGAIWLP